jgi:hypothetical protein
MVTTAYLVMLLLFYYTVNVLVMVNFVTKACLYL